MCGRAFKGIKETQQDRTSRNNQPEVESRGRWRKQKVMIGGSEQGGGWGRGLINSIKGPLKERKNHAELHTTLIDQQQKTPQGGSNTAQKKREQLYRQDRRGVSTKNPAEKPRIQHRRKKETHGVGWGRSKGERRGQNGLILKRIKARKGTIDFLPPASTKKWKSLQTREKKVKPYGGSTAGKMAKKLRVKLN